MLQGQNQDVGWCGFLKRGSRGESTSKPIHAMGRIRTLAALGLRSSLVSLLTVLHSSPHCPLHLQASNASSQPFHTSHLSNLHSWCISSSLTAENAVLLRTHLISFGLLIQSRLISLYNLGALNYICRILLPYKVMYSQIPEFRVWTSLGGPEIHEPSEHKVR